MNKLVIFDLDGTITDTLPDITFSVNYMLNKFGFGNITLQDARKFVGNGARNLVIQSLNKCGYNLPDEKIDECTKCYSDYYTQSGSPKTKVFDGMGEVLTELKKRGYLLAVLSNKPQSTTDTVNERFLKDFGFSIVRGSLKTEKLKPDPTSTLKIISQLNCDKDSVYFVGDGDTDVFTAINAGVKNIAVLWGYRDKADLQKAGAEIFASTPKDLLKILK